MEKTIIIGGGVGPAAGLILHRLIIDNTMADVDQDYLRTIHMSVSDLVPDRSESIKAGCPERPALGMAKVVEAGMTASAAVDRQAVAGIACNTFHAPPIWKIFNNTLKDKGILREDDSPLSVLNMIDETVAFISGSYPRGASIGVLSTEGTCLEKIYSDPLSAAGFRVLEPEGQKITHEIIYNREWGIKACPEVTEKARDALNGEVIKLKEQGAELIILACTELPLVLTGKSAFGTALLNPMEVLARALVNAAAPEKLLKLSS
jgi:aspartate racemase